MPKKYISFFINFLNSLIHVFILTYWSFSFLFLGTLYILRSLVLRDMFYTYALLFVDNDFLNLILRLSISAGWGGADPAWLPGTLYMLAWSRPPVPALFLPTGHRLPPGWGCAVV